MDSTLTERNPASHSLLLAERFLPHAGGSRVYYYHLMRNWEPDRVTVFTKKTPGWEEFDREESTEHFHILRKFAPMPSLKYKDLPKAILPMLQACVLASRRAVDVVHCGDLFPCGVSALFLKRSLGIPFVTYCHGEDITLTERSRFQPGLRTHIYMSADVVIANSDSSRRLLRKIGVPDERIRKITPGVDFDVFRPAPRSARLIARYGLYGFSVLLTVARLVPRKGHDMVMQSVARLRRDFPRLKYLIVGKGPEEPRLRQLAAELNIEQNVVFAGLVPQQELADHYRLADVMVMPNRAENGDMEGFGMTFLEASATGKPVVGGRSGGAAEAVSDGITGTLVDPNDVEDLTAAIHELLSQPRRAATMGKAGLDRARSEFNWETRAQELQLITRNVAAGRRKRKGYVSSQAGIAGRSV